MRGRRWRWAARSASFGSGAVGGKYLAACGKPRTGPTSGSHPQVTVHERRDSTARPMRSCGRGSVGPYVSPGAAAAPYACGQDQGGCTLITRSLLHVAMSFDTAVSRFGVAGVLRASCLFDLAHLATTTGRRSGRQRRTSAGSSPRTCAPYRDELVISTKAGYDMWPGPYGDWGSRKYLLSSLDQSLAAHGPGLRRHLLLAPRRPRDAAEETMGALDTAVRSGKALYVGHVVLLGRAHRGGRRGSCASWARRCSSTSPPTRSSTAGSRRSCSTSSDARAWAASSFSPLAQGLLTDRYLSIPEDSRVAPGQLASPRTDHGGEPRPRARAQRDRPAPRPDPGADGASPGCCATSGSRPPSSGRAASSSSSRPWRALDRLDFDDDELAEIDRYAQEGDVNIWASSSAVPEGAPRPPTPPPPWPGGRTSRGRSCRGRPCAGAPRRA